MAGTGNEFVATYDFDESEDASEESMGFISHNGGDGEITLLKRQKIVETPELILKYVLYSNINPSNNG